MTIEIIGKCKDKREVLEEAKNRKQADNAIDYWQELKGSKWKISSKVVR